MEGRFALVVVTASVATFAAVWTLTAPLANPPLKAAGMSPSSAVIAPPALSAGKAVHAPRARRREGHVVARRPERVRTAAVEIYYAGCNEVRAAGLAPLYRDDPGYRSDMDGDGDGIACEPHRF